MLLLKTCIFPFLVVLNMKQIEEEYVHELLEGPERPDPYSAQGVLEDLPSSATKMKVCDRKKRK